MGSFGSVTSTNNIFTSNNATNAPGIYAQHGGTSDHNLFYGGDAFNCSGGTCVNTNAVSGNPNLAPLGSYGGAIQTMLPLPGSAAICAGTLTNAQAAGLATDQRGDGLDSNCPAGAVDLGAVQTGYALGFTTSPSSSQTEYVALTPAPVVTLTESGSGLTAGSASLSVAAASGTLSGTATAGTSTATATAGQASFQGLSITPVESGDYLTGSLAITAAGVTPAVTLTAKSGSFNVNPVHLSVNSPANAAAGTPFNVIVTALDANNNPVPSFADTVSFSSTDGSAVLPGNQTFSANLSGQETFQVTLKTAGSQTITASDVTSPSIQATSGSIQVRAGTATHITVSAPSNATAGTAFNLTVTALTLTTTPLPRLRTRSASPARMAAPCFPPTRPSAPTQAARRRSL